jgi:hypothetical protein
MVNKMVGMGFENTKQYTTEAMISGYMNAYRAVSSDTDHSESA